MWTPKTERCAFLVDNLDLPEAAQFEDARWEHFQLEHLQDDSQFRIENKSRQIAWSWLVAAEAVADAILNGVGTIFQSINLGEAQEKIRYAHNVRYALPSSMRLKLITDNKQELEFDNGARLISLPGNPQRGKAQMNVVFDEFAHIQKDAAVYTAALPVATKGNRRIRAGSVASSSTIRAATGSGKSSPSSYGRTQATDAKGRRGGKFRHSARMYAKRDIWLRLWKHRSG